MDDKMNNSIKTLIEDHIIIKDLTNDKILLNKRANEQKKYSGNNNDINKRKRT